MEGEALIVGKAVEYGVLGILVIALGYYVRWLSMQHREERKEWREDAKATRAEDRVTTDKLADAISKLDDTLRRGS